MNDTKFVNRSERKKVQTVYAERAAAPCSSSRGIYLYMCHGCFASLSPSLSQLSLPPSHPSFHPHPRIKKNPGPLRTNASHLAALPLRLPRTVHVRDLGNELGREDVDLLVGAVQQAQSPDLIGRGRVVSRGLGFLAAVSGLESCDFGGLRVVRKKYP
jgi:hypothetical protein